MVMIAANADAIWERLVVAMGRPDLATNDSFATHEARGTHADEVDAHVAAWTRTLDFNTLGDILTNAHVPHGLIYRAPDIVEDAQYAAREMVQRVFDGILGHKVPMPAVVPRLLAHRVRSDGAATTLAHIPKRSWPSWACPKWNVQLCEWPE
jgi:formyl-CoA transferase